MNPPLILTVDDNPNNIKVIVDFLKESGFKTLVAKSGELCLQALEKISPDLILLDVIMPGMDGFETCIQIKADEKTKDIPVIFMTAISDNPEDRIKGLTIGAVDYIGKPIIREEVLARINVHLNLRRVTKELIEAKEAAEAANRAKSLFLAQMHHELRTPMTGILGFAEILKSQETSKFQKRQYAEFIYESGSHLLNLIDDILDLSKIEAGKMELDPTDFALDSLLENVIQICRLRGEEKGIYVNYKPGEKLPKHILSDEKRLRQVLINLLGNAIKFTEKGTVTLKVDVITDASEIPSIKPGKIHKIRFEVRDTGIGIDSEQLYQIFLPFEQAGERRYKAKGTGLGLAISQQIVEMMGSKIQVSSQPGVGSVFWMDLDLPESVEVASNFLNSISTTVDAKLAEQLPLRILVAEDEGISQKIALLLLKRLGYSADVAGSGEEVLEALRRQFYDVIFMDTQMPDMDGIETARRIFQEWKESARPCIVATSANTMLEHQQECLATGMDDFIGKPFGLEDFARSLRRCKVFK